MMHCRRQFRLLEKETRLIANVFGNQQSMESDLHAEFDDHAAQWKAGSEKMAKQGPDQQRKLDAGGTARESLREDDVNKIATELEQKIGKGLDPNRKTMQNTKKQLRTMEGGRKTSQDELDAEDEAVTVLASTMTMPAGGAFIPEAQTKSGEGVQKEAVAKQEEAKVAVDTPAPQPVQARGPDTSSAADRSLDSVVKAAQDQSNTKQQTTAEQGPRESQERRA